MPPEMYELTSAAPLHYLQQAVKYTRRWSLPALALHRRASGLKNNSKLTTYVRSIGMNYDGKTAGNEEEWNILIKLTRDYILF